ISPDSLDELSHGLEALLRSPDRALQIGASARQTILNGLTLAHQAHNLATLYRQAAVLHAQDRAL
ncbi:MAG: glycosyltransferase, partial [Terriglobales bacterium]